MTTRRGLTLLRSVLPVIAALAGRTLAAEPAPAPLRLAILATEPSPGTKNLADLLPLDLQQAGVEIVERGELDRVLAEQQLTAAGLASGAAGRVAVGKLLRADGFLFTGLTANDEKLSVRLVESRHGFQVCQMLFRTNELALAPLAERIGGAVKAKLPVLRLADDKRILVGVLRIGNATLDPRAGWIEEVAPFLLSACLSAHPAVLTLERRELGTLLDESLSTAGEASQLRTADLLIDGDVFLAGGETLSARDRTLTLVLRIRDGRLAERLRLERKGKAADLERLIAEMAADLLARIGSLRPGAGGGPTAEPALLLDLAHRNGGAGGSGLWAIEAAYALDATNTAIRAELIRGLLAYGHSYAHGVPGGNPRNLSEQAYMLDRARHLVRATDLIVSSPDPAAMPGITDYGSGGGLMNQPTFRRYPDLVEMLRPVRALARLELEKQILAQTYACHVLCRKFHTYCENATEEALYTASLIQRVVTDPATPPVDRQIRAAVMLEHMGAPPGVRRWASPDDPAPLPLSFYEGLCRLDDPVIPFFSHVKAAEVGPDSTTRLAHAREALKLLDGLFDQTNFLKRQAANYASVEIGHGPDDYVRLATGKFSASGPEWAREVNAILARHFSDWLAAGDLATLCDVMGFDYFPLLEPKTAAGLLGEAMKVRQAAGARLPKTRHGLKTLARLEEAWKSQLKEQGGAVPLQPGDTIVLLSSQSPRWQKMGGNVFYEFGNWNLPLTPQRLLVEGDTLWVALGGYNTVDVFDHQVGSLLYTKRVVTARTALLQMDLATGRILSYRLGERKNPEQTNPYALSPLFAWRDSICFGERHVGLHVCPRRCGADDRSFDGVRLIGTNEGLPSLDITGAAALGDTLYVGLPSLLLSLPGGTGPPIGVAATSTETAGGPMAGAGRIFGLASDEEKGRLFVLTDGHNATNGTSAIWRHAPADGSFTRLPLDPPKGRKNLMRGGIMANVPGRILFTNRRGTSYTDGLTEVTGCFRMSNETLTNRPVDGLPPTTFLGSRYECVPYKGGSIAIGGEGKDWEILYFIGCQPAEADSLSWAAREAGEQAKP